MVSDPATYDDASYIYIYISFIDGPALTHLADDLHLLRHHLIVQRHAIPDTRQPVSHTYIHTYIHTQRTIVDAQACTRYVYGHYYEISIPIIISISTYISVSILSLSPALSL
jgi:hypothetical protein